jgi:hypothetical protein
MVLPPEPAEPLGCLKIRDHRRPGRIRRRMSDIDDDDIAYLVASEEVAPSKTAEGDSQIRAGGAVDVARKQINSRWTIDRHDGDFEVQQSSQHRSHLRPRCAGSSGAEERIYYKPETGPRAVRCDLPDSFRAGERGHSVTQLGALSDGSHPDGHIYPVEGSGDNPPITPIVAGPGGHQHAGAQEVRIPIRDDHRRGTSGVLHQRSQLDAGAHREAVPVVGLFGSEDGDHAG